MYCEKCGTEISESQKFCPVCGAKNQEYSNAVLETVISKANEIAPATNDNIATNMFKKPIRRLMLMVVGIVAVILCLAIGMGIFFHFNSDEYKIEKATELVLLQSYTEATNKLSSVYTPQAEVIENYINVLQARDEFLNSFQAAALMTSEHQDIIDKANLFKDKLYEFKGKESVYLLPSSLKQQYDYYICFCEKIDKACYNYTDFSKSIYSMYMEVQDVFLNPTTRNRSDSFTLLTMQNHIETSKTAIGTINEWLNNLEDFSNSANKFSGLNDDNCPPELRCFYDSTKNLINACNQKIDSEQGKLDKDLKEFDLNDKVYLVHPDKNYKAYVLYDLNEIADANDIGQNAIIYQNTYMVEIMAYCLLNY